MKNILKSTAVITCIAVVSIIILATCNYFWKVDKTVIGIPEELRLKLEQLTGSTDFSEVDTTGIEFTGKVISVYRANDGEQANALIMYTEDEIVYGIVRMLTAFDKNNDKILGVTEYNSEQKTTFYVNHFNDRAYAVFKGADVSKLTAQTIASSDGVSKETYTAGSMVACVKAAAADYTANKAALIAAPVKSGSLLKVTLKQITDEIKPDSVARFEAEVTSTDIKIVDTADNKEFTVTFKATLDGAEVAVTTMWDSSKKVYYTEFKAAAGSYVISAEAASKDNKHKASGQIALSVVGYDVRVMSAIRMIYPETQQFFEIYTDTVNKFKYYVTDQGNLVSSAYGFRIDADGVGYVGTLTAFIAINTANDTVNRIGVAYYEDGNAVYEVTEPFLNKFRNAAIVKGQKITSDIMSGATATGNVLVAGVLKFTDYYIEHTAKAMFDSASLTLDERLSLFEAEGCGIGIKNGGFYELLNGKKIAIGSS